MAKGPSGSLPGDAGGGVDAPVAFAWAPNVGVGEGFTAQLYGGPSDASVDSLQPLYPTTTFRTDTPHGRFFVQPVVVTVPGQPPLSTASFIMRVFNGPDWESSTIRGESHPTVAVLGGGEGFPRYLVNLQGFYVHVIPEPSVGMLVCFGAGLVFWLRRKRR